MQPVSICLLQNILGELADGLEKLKKYGIFFWLFLDFEYDTETYGMEMVQVTPLRRTLVSSP